MADEPWPAALLLCFSSTASNALTAETASARLGEDHQRRRGPPRRRARAHSGARAAVDGLRGGALCPGGDYREKIRKKIYELEHRLLIPLLNLMGGWRRKEAAAPHGCHALASPRCSARLAFCVRSIPLPN